MSNEKSMSTGGANSAIGPVLMRKAAPFRGSTKNMIASEQNIENLKETYLTILDNRL